MKEVIKPELDRILKEIQRYETRIGGGCECCGTWVELEEDNCGELIKYDELKKLIERIRQS